MKTVRTRAVLFSIAFFLAYFSTLANGFFSEPMKDYTLQTLYIFNFAKYVEWPTATRSIKIGVVGNTSAEDHLVKVAKAKSSAGVEINVINSLNESDLGSCQIIFVPVNNTKLADQLIENFNNRPILIVTEEADFTQKGACVSFKIVSGKLRFQINEEAIKSRGLKVSGALSSLAEK
ncbi:YfiR family protein [Chryseolinea sp. H1M3-3]|uniref:YfiR family protein n=1 Tax=Chryseolinea sp. H1M3-3 TaxID=3034144 RepID=UPI0023EA9A77|nr:YfiR family protein [Chryseolinea sp. H1M3-3]